MQMENTLWDKSLVRYFHCSQKTKKHFECLISTEKMSQTLVLVALKGMYIFSENDVCSVTHECYQSVGEDQ